MLCKLFLQNNHTPTHITQFNPFLQTFLSHKESKKARETSSLFKLGVAAIKTVVLAMKLR